MESTSIAANKVEVFRVPERLHAGNAKDVLKGIASGPGTSVLLDLADTIAIDSTALGEIVKLHRRLISSGGSVAFAAPSTGIRKVLGITRLDTIFTIHPTVDAGLRAAVVVP